MNDDDSDIDLVESIGSIGSLLTNTINQIRASQAQIQTAIGGTQPTTTTTTTSSLAPVLIIAAAVGLGFYLWKRS